MFHVTESVPHILQGCFLYPRRSQGNNVIGRPAKNKDKFQTKHLANTTRSTELKYQYSYVLLITQTSKRHTSKTVIKPTTSKEEGTPCTLRRVARKF